MIGCGAGHIADMIGRIKANEALLCKKRYFKTIKKYRKILRTEDKRSEQTTNDEKAKIRNKVLIERKHEIKYAALVLVISIIFTVLLVFVMYMIYHFLRE